MRLFCLILALGTVVYAQQTGVSGRLTDQSGAVVVSAIVKIADTKSGAQVATLSNDQGLYTFPTLLASEYKLRVEAPGCRLSLFRRKATPSQC